MLLITGPYRLCWLIILIILWHRPCHPCLREWLSESICVRSVHCQGTGRRGLWEAGQKGCWDESKRGHWDVDLTGDRPRMKSVWELGRESGWGPGSGTGWKPRTGTDWGPGAGGCVLLSHKSLGQIWWQELLWCGWSKVVQSCWRNQPLT